MTLAPDRATLLGYHVYLEPGPMRAAATVAGAIIAVGIYLALAATFAFSPASIALGMLAIAATAAIGLMALDGRVPGAPEI